MLLIIYLNNKRFGFGIGKEERACWLLSSSASLPMWGTRVSSVVLTARGGLGAPGASLLSFPAPPVSIRRLRAEVPYVTFSHCLLKVRRERHLREMAFPCSYRNICFS